MKEFLVKKYENITIGRDKTNIICINDKGVSAHHAMIKNFGDRLQIIDNNSTNGTYVNGYKVLVLLASKSQDYVNQFG